MAKLHISWVQAVEEGFQIMTGVVADAVQLEGLPIGDISTEQKVPMPHEIEVALGNEHIMITGVTAYRKK